LRNIIPDVLIPKRGGELLKIYKFGENIRLMKADLEE